MEYEEIIECAEMGVRTNFHNYDWRETAIEAASLIAEKGERGSELAAIMAIDSEEEEMASWVRENPFLSWDYIYSDASIPEILGEKKNENKMAG